MGLEMTRDVGRNEPRTGPPGIKRTGLLVQGADQGTFVAVPPRASPLAASLNPEIPLPEEAEDEPVYAGEP